MVESNGGLRVQNRGGNVSVDNFPSSQRVFGSVWVQNIPLTQRVRGNVTVDNLPETQQVSGQVDILPDVSTIVNLRATGAELSCADLSYTVPEGKALLVTDMAAYIPDGGSSEYAGLATDTEGEIFRLGLPLRGNESIHWNTPLLIGTGRTMCLVAIGITDTCSKASQTRSWHDSGRFGTRLLGFPDDEPRQGGLLATSYPGRFSRWETGKAEVRIVGAGTGL